MSDSSSDTAPITPEQVEQHGLSQAEYGKVLEILGRAPNIT